MTAIDTISGCDHRGAAGKQIGIDLESSQKGLTWHLHYASNYFLSNINVLLKQPNIYHLLLRISLIASHTLNISRQTCAIYSE